MTTPQPLRPCPTCGRITPGGHCPHHPRSKGGYRPHRRSHHVYRNPAYRQLRRATLDAAGWRCAYCHNLATTADHVIPHTRGGTTDAANLVAACRTCNTSKGDRTLVEWIATGLAPQHAGRLLRQRDKQGLPS